MNLDTIIVAAISLLGTLAGSYFANSKTIALLSYRLEQLERKVEKHNSVWCNAKMTAFPSTCRPRSAGLTRSGKRCTSIRRRKESRDGGGGRNPLRLSRLFF